jgi:hypothetical protein
MKCQISVVRLIFAGFICSLMLWACKKDTINTPPGLEFVEVSSFDVSPGDLLAFRLRITGKREDVQDTIWVRAFTNLCPQYMVNIPYPLPRHPNINLPFLIYRIDPDVGLPWVFNLCPGVDTTNFQFWVQDVQGNVLGPVGPDRPILIRNQ